MCELATLLHITSTEAPMYGVGMMQCYWFAGTMFDALKELFSMDRI